MRRLLLRLRKSLRSWWSARRGAAKAMADLRYIRQVARVSLLIVPLVLTPVLVLAGLALRSLRSEELLVDANLEQRAEAIAAQVQTGERALFTAFEEDVMARLRSGETGMETLTAPGLRGAFHFDADGKLAWPFTLPDPSPEPPPSAAWARLAQAASEAEAAGRMEEALRAWGELAERDGDPPRLRATARLAQARLGALADPIAGIEALVFVANDFPDTRDVEGRRVADLATLLRADLQDRRGAYADGAALRRGVVERALASAWVVGHPSDGLLARLAIDRLGSAMAQDARRLATRRLVERLERMHWASERPGELRLVGTRGGPVGTFSYQPEERALWVVLQQEGGLWAFSFDVATLRDALAERVVAAAARVDPDLTATLVGPTDVVPNARARRSLAPELPRVEVVVQPTDPDGLRERRARSATLQGVVIALAVLATGLGLALTVRTIDQELESARQKADFAANVSHELRSPITQIRLKAESLQLDLAFDDDDRRAHYDAIVRESERLSRLVDNVLDFSSIERGVKRYHRRPDDLGEIVMKAVDATQGTAEAAGFVIGVDLPEDLPVVWVDREAIGQVLTNLLSNAIKYGGEDGEIEVSVRDRLDGVDVSVRDHGIGISPEDKDHVFDHFFRVQSADVRKRRGTGIGLTIVRYIVEAHGGTISVESALGHGSTFTVSLPLEPPDDLGA